jgi:acetylornithine deacetylase/succinyl-diaminopimelate desuccinylase-like protein
MKKYQAVDLLKKLISIPSYVSDSVNEIEVGNFIFDFLSERTDLTIEKQEVEKGRFNIIAFKNKSPRIIFFGHMDTVPPKVETTLPFEGREEQGRIYGLGSVDMKAGLAIMLDIAQRHSNSDDLAFVFTVDEEYEFKGAYKLIEKYKFNPEYVINVEPTSLKILNGCRGVTEFAFKVHGTSAHAAMKSKGVNAIEKTVELFDLLQKDLMEFDRGDVKNSVNLAYLNGGYLDENGGVGYSGNVVPNYAQCVGEIRLTDSRITEKYLKKKFMELAEKIQVSVSDIQFKFLLGSMYTDRVDIKIFETAIIENGMECEYASVNEGGYFEVQLLQEKWNGKVIVFGPGPDSNAHKVDEYVETETIEKTLDVFESFIKMVL